MNLTFYLDYAPYLTQANPKAFILYCFYDKLKGDAGVAHLPFKDITSHLGIQNSTITKAHQTLIDLGLIERITDSERFRGNRYRILEPQPLDSNKKKELFDKVNLTIDASFQEKFCKVSTQIPDELLPLFDFDKMKEAYEALGGEGKFSIKNLVKHFGLDVTIVRPFLKNESFISKLYDVRDKVKNSVTIVQKETKRSNVKRSVKKTTGVKSTKSNIELYKQFMEEGNLTRKDKKEMLIADWKSPQLLWYFCQLYKKKYGLDFTFTTSLYKSKEMKDMSRILGTFNNAQEVKEYFDWVFNVKEKDLNGIDSTGIVAHTRMINEFKKTNSPKASGKVGVDFKDWVKKNAKGFLDISDCETVDNLQFAQEAVRTGDADETTKKVIEEAIKRGIL